MIKFQNFIAKVLFPKSYDKRYESDREMLLRVSRKFVAIFFIFLMFDTLLTWFLGLIDIVIHLLHLIIQTIEYALLLFLEHLFQTNQQQSETIIVNVTIIIALYLLYRYILAAPSIAKRIKHYLQSAWLQHIKHESSCWKAASFRHKVKCISAYSLGATCLVFLI